MTWTRLLLNFGAMILIAGAIMYFGPRLSAHIEKSEQKKVDKNPVLIKAIIVRKRSHKGKSVYFRYQYKGETYTNSKGGTFHYNRLDIGDEIEIRLDSTNPGNSYIT
jgi:hypothetical protein